MVVGGGGALAASPTELVLAKSTSHVVAALILLDSSATHRTKGDIIFVFFCPALQLIFHSLLTSDVFSMPFISALETKLSLAFVAS